MFASRGGRESSAPRDRRTRWLARPQGEYQDGSAHCCFGSGPLPKFGSEPARDVRQREWQEEDQALRARRRAPRCRISASCETADASRCRAIGQRPSGSETSFPASRGSATTRTPPASARCLAAKRNTRRLPGCTLGKGARACGRQFVEVPDMPGDHRLAVRIQGFQQVLRSDIPLSVNTVARSRMFCNCRTLPGQS